MSPEALAAYVSARLAPITADASRLMRGDEARAAACAAAAGRWLSPRVLDEIGRTIALIPGTLQRLRAIQARCDAIRAQAGEAALAAAAWTQLVSLPSGALPMPALLAAMVDSLSSALEDVAASQARAAGAGAGAAELVWLDGACDAAPLMRMCASADSAAQSWGVPGSTACTRCCG